VEEVFGREDYAGNPVAIRADNALFGVLFVGY